jgi:DNA-binding transcriptional regulator LsrR (DeoR family)
MNCGELPIRKTAAAPVIGAAMGPSKLAAIPAALIGQLISGLFTDEATAKNAHQQIAFAPGCKRSRDRA